jgi:hypothetical protein
VWELGGAEGGWVERRERLALVDVECQFGKKDSEQLFVPACVVLTLLLCSGQVSSKNNNGWSGLFMGSAKGGLARFTSLINYD